MKRPTFVAEVSANHNGSLKLALHTIKAAALAGADMVKFQTFAPSQMVGDVEYIVPDGPWAGESLRDLYAKAHTPREWHHRLFAEARKYGLTPFSSPFHPDDVSFLETIDCPAYKIASFEIGYDDLLAAVSKTGKQIIISTGAATEYDIQHALDVIGEARYKEDRDITLLKCTSSYPAAEADANLSAMTLLSKWINCKVGISDHSTGLAIPAAATALGATMIEKHFTLPGIKSLDSAFSLTPDKYLEMVELCTGVAESIGDPVLNPTETGKNFSRGLWYAALLMPGDILERHHIKVARPAGKLSAQHLDSVLGKRLRKSVSLNQPVETSDFQ